MPFAKLGDLSNAFQSCVYFLWGCNCKHLPICCCSRIGVLSDLSSVLLMGHLPWARLQSHQDGSVLLSQACF